MPASLVNHTGLPRLRPRLSRFARLFESLRLPQNDRAFERKTFRTRSQAIARETDCFATGLLMTAMYSLFTWDGAAETIIDLP